MIDLWLGSPRIGAHRRTPRPLSE